MFNDETRERLMSTVLLEDLTNLQPLIKRTIAIIGLDAFVQLCFEIGGVPLYLPKIESVLAKARDRVIIQEFTGYNYSDLALRYGVTEAWVRRLISKEKSEDNAISLFDEQAG